MNFGQLAAFGLLIMVFLGALTTGTLPIVVTEDYEIKRSNTSPTTTPTISETNLDNKTTKDNLTAGLNPNRVELLIHAHINAKRTNQGLNTLKFDSALQKIAKNHSRVMAKHGEIFHTQPDGNTRKDRYKAAGYECEVGGAENVAYTYYLQDVIAQTDTVYHDTPMSVANGIVNQWMNSTEGHRQIILKDDWQNEGIGVSVTRITGDIMVFVTQVFC